MKCRICDLETVKYDVFTNMAKQVSILYNKPTNVIGREIKMFLCLGCNHYQIEYFNEENYYDNYIMLPSADSIYSFRQRQIKQLFLYNTSVKSFIEIGCGDGGFLKHASNYYDRVVGNEPSSIYNELTKNNGFECTSDYINQSTLIKEKFDSICAKQVFEHLQTPIETLSKMWEMLNNEGTGFIEVPNGAKTIYNKRYFDIFTDHVNYFTPTSLSKMVEKCGFNVIKIEETFGGDYLECYFQKEIIQTKIEEKRNDDYNFIKSHIQNKSNIGAYGAGAKGYSILTSLDIGNQLKFIFDDDINKQGLFLPNTPSPITKPTIQDISMLDTIIIFAASYQDVIIKNLINKYNFKGEILGLQNKPILIKT